MSDQPLEDQLLHRVEDGVAWITFNRPDAGNAFTQDMRNRMIDLLGAASDSADVRAVVIGAAGEKHFCTGADLRAGRAAQQADGAPERATGDAARLIRIGIQRMIGGILDCEKPVLCALNGTAAGGGAQVVLACDLIVAAEHARIIQVFVRRGLIPDGGGTYLLPRRVPLQKAKELIFFGDDLSAADAERIGLVNKVVPAAELEAETKKWATKLAQGPTFAIGLSKRLLNRSLQSDLDTCFAEEAFTQALASNSEDMREGIRSFMEKRSPAFKGR